MSFYSRFGHISKEVGNNLFRNITLVLATVATVWVSLTLFGAALIIREGVQQATSRWSGGIEFIVFMDQASTVEQNNLIQNRLNESPDIESFEYFNQDRSYEEFLEFFAESPELVENVNPVDLPPSYRVIPQTSNPDIIESIAQEFERSPGVLRVVLATDTIRTLQNNSERISTFVLVTAIVVLLAALLLIFNTIGTAIFARREDIEVMKLVGASNWYIRIPFVVEGTIQGIVGAVLAVPMLFLLNNLLRGFVEGDNLELLRSLVVDNSVVWSSSIWVLIIGAGVGAIGSGVAIGRHLDA